ncbi:hypothetical protein A2954_04525 [Candidatus Roizmanbacteria bacterium RIFCSPLOWO2_01_FULL_37_12]|uniref:DUF11 domain-containing protein n=1 Tax=Candidatus Roizmanbacteria bacterium RIFCSPLOWO2_01_FULL_37_12 TaxID=1802056 RepID=A0A1F7IFW0_9BACT|nr:MAG: hypothetical protein A3D76_02540 [Candidatus Roizmanbacteria bacterium RIFCSPHIGHO2_02_FULL_37_9b]OGK42246.1 MAG: hypothetical protein A2954_04525 [Candidatus Roizmanbacteria bacterium RIFCSPLOWO2_01_FULL_37_12]
MKRLVTNLLLAISFLLTTTFVFAGNGPYGQEEPSFSIMVDKLVTKPHSTSDFVDNLSPSDERYSPGNDVYFKIKVKNTSDEKLKDVTVRDFLPDFVKLVDSKGSFNSDTDEITVDAGDLEVDEEKEFVIKVKIVDQDELPSDNGLFCLVNKAQASNDKSSDEDTAQFCVEKKVLGVSSVPSAGPEQGVALILGQLSALGIGVFLKKKTS